MTPEQQSQVSELVTMFKMRRMDKIPDEVTWANLRRDYPNHAEGAFITAQQEIEQENE